MQETRVQSLGQEDPWITKTFALLLNYLDFTELKYDFIWCLDAIGEYVVFKIFSKEYIHNGISTWHYFAMYQ